MSGKDTLSPTRRLIAEVCYAPIHMAERIKGALVSRRNRLLSEAHRTARYMPQSFVTNLSDRRDAIRIGEGTVVRAHLMVFAHGGEIQIGDWCYLGEGARLWSAAGITIGDRVLISHDVELHDTNAHARSASERYVQFRELLATGHQRALPNVARKAVVIGNDVWIGFRSVVLKGVVIGDGAIVAANSLVLDDVPPWTVVAGAPAQVVRHLEPEHRPIGDRAGIDPVRSQVRL